MIENRRWTLRCLSLVRNFQGIVQRKIHLIVEYVNLTILSCDNIFYDHSTRFFETQSGSEQTKVNMQCETQSDNNAYISLTDAIIDVNRIFIGFNFAVHFFSFGNWPRFCALLWVEMARGGFYNKKSKTDWLPLPQQFPPRHKIPPVRCPFRIVLNDEKYYAGNYYSCILQCSLLFHINSIGCKSVDSFWNST